MLIGDISCTDRYVSDCVQLRKSLQTNFIINYIEPFIAEELSVLPCKMIDASYPFIVAKSSGPMCPLFSFVCEEGVVSQDLPFLMQKEKKEKENPNSCNFEKCLGQLPNSVVYCILFHFCLFSLIIMIDLKNWVFYEVLFYYERNEFQIF